MTDTELIERTRKAIDDFFRLPDEEIMRRLIAKGTINGEGEVLMGDEDKKEEKCTHNSPAVPREAPR